MKAFVLVVALSSMIATHKTWAECTPDTVYNSIEFSEIARAGASARLQNPILDQLGSLTANIKNRGGPIGASLSYQDNATFQRLSDTLQAMQINDYIESDRARDAEFTYKMTDEAWKHYADPSFSGPNGDLPWAVLSFENLIMPNMKDVSASTDSDCTMDFALAAQAQQSMTRLLGIIGVARQAAAEMDTLRAKYHVQTDDDLPSGKMSQEDQQAEIIARVSMAPVLREQELLISLENIRVWWSTCILIYQSRQIDVRTYGPSWDVIGSTIANENAALPTNTKALINLWLKVDVRYPSDERKELLEVARLQQLTK